VLKTLSLAMKERLDKEVPLTNLGDRVRQLLTI
jgi:hypothetical protein